MNSMRERLIAAAARSSVLGPHTRYVAGLLRPSIRFRRTGEAPRLGRSRLGGHPDLPVATPWPNHAGGPHEFVAQFDLGELAEPVCGLPASGLLSFFVATAPIDEVFWRDDGYVRAIHTPPGVALVPTAPPALSAAQEADLPRGFAHGLVEGFAIRLAPTIGIPCDKEQRSDWPGDPDELLSALQAVHAEVTGGGGGPVEQLLGYPPVSSLGYDPTPGGDWLPLLTLASHDDLDWCWHDGDYLHVFIQRDRLLDGDVSTLKADAG